VGDVFHQQKFQVVCFFGIGFRGRALAMEKERNDVRDAQAQTVSLRSVTPKLFLMHQLQVLLEQFFFIIVMVFAPHQGDLFLLGSYLQSGTRTPRLLWALGPYRRCVVESRP